MRLSLVMQKTFAIRDLNSKFPSRMNFKQTKRDMDIRLISSVPQPTTTRDY